MFNKLNSLKPDSLEACLGGFSRGLGTGRYVQMPINLVSLRLAGFPALANQVCS